MKIGTMGSVLCSAILLAAPLVLAAPAVEWTSALPEPAEQWTYGVVPVADGYVVGGTHLVQPGNPRSGGSEECMLLKTGLDGAQLWRQIYHPAYMAMCNGLAPAADGGFLLAGGSYASYYYGDGRAVLVRTDAAGAELWTRFFDANSTDYLDPEYVDTTYATDVRATADGGFVVLATRAPIDSPASPIMLVKLDADGNELWRTFPGDPYAEGMRVSLVDDGGFIVAGWRFIGGGEAFYLLRTDAAGQRLWSAYYLAAPMSIGMGVRQTPDGGFAAVGYAGEYGVLDSSDAHILKVDGGGTQQWVANFGGPGDDWAFDLMVAPDGGLVATGGQRSVSSEELGMKLFVSKFSAAGEPRWELLMDGNPVDGVGYAQGAVIAPTADGGAIIAGEISGEDPVTTTSADTYLVKLAPESLLPPVAVRIDVKPGSAANPINLRAQGTVPVAILTTKSFDAATVVKSTLAFAGAPVALKTNGRTQAALEDVDGDGDEDLLAHFPISGLKLSVGDTTATLTGATTDGAEVSGTDSVQVKSTAVGRKRKKR